jgi:uncharacterized protein (UPF0548 family)
LFSLSRPSDEQLRSILEQQKDAPFSYADVGASGDAALPDGYNVDRYRTKLGAGMTTFAAAKLALQRWQMFDRSWLRVFPEDVEIREGAAVAVVAAHLGFYSINLCRIVCLVDSEGPVSTFGFAYGTLLEHAESGEERFTVSWNKSDDSVWYEIVAFSRPRAVLARIGYPISRMMQRKFGRTSLAAMMRVVLR